MSDVALQGYEKVRMQQLSRNQARHIRTKVKDAQGAYDAGLRWPFELLQNALDGGPREGHSLVEITLSYQNNRVAFTHDGAPFSLQDLAALLSGGSSKDFESETTTGRFGTGFLVTHVLADQTRVRGLLKSSIGFERFDLTLNRAGDEQAILGNIERCNEAIEAAEPLTTIVDEPSVHFEYFGANTEALRLGIDSLRHALPYLYATCAHLGTVRLHHSDESTEIWSPGEISEERLAGGVARVRPVRVETPEAGQISEYKSLRFVADENAKAAVIYSIEDGPDGPRVCIPGPEIARIFVKFPIRSSASLQVNFIIDGSFDPEQERKSIHINDNGKKLIEEALTVASIAVEYATARNFRDAYLLARIGESDKATLGDSEAERKWWAAELGKLAKRLAAMPLVETTEGHLPATNELHKDAAIVSFVTPMWPMASTLDRAAIECLWPIVASVSEFHPPVLSLAVEWWQIIKGWKGLGVGVSEISIESLTARVTTNASVLNELPISGEPREWLVDLIDVVGEAWSRRQGSDIKVLQRLLPDQRGSLRSPRELAVDGGIPEVLKDIASSLGRDVKSRLLDQNLEEIARARNRQNFSKVLSEVTLEPFGDEKLINELISHLELELKEGAKASGTAATLITGSIRLLAYLWEHRGKAAVVTARKCPLISLEGTIVRWAPERMMMAPVDAWSEKARPFYSAYPSTRILAAVYLGSGAENIPNIVNVLVAWDIAISDPLSTVMPAELKDDRLAALAETGQDTKGMVLTGEKFSQIALLQPEVINRCREGKEEAKALLGLMLNYMAPGDPLWTNVRTVTGRHGGAPFEIRVRGALWLADLMSKAWVPSVGEGKTTHVLADSATLKDLMDPKWLTNNPSAVSLLTKFFKFDGLDLRLIGISNPDVLQQIRENLARVVELANADPDIIARYSYDFEEKQRHAQDMKRLRSIGLAVQSAIGDALRAHHLKVDLIDRGFDFDVSLEDGHWQFEVGSYLLEVKATTSGEVRLTPTQASMATTEAHRYVLCAVDLRGMPADRLTENWCAGDVEPLARLVEDIGVRTKNTCELIASARTSEVGIRNDQALRYSVPSEIWMAGCSIPDWVARIAQSLVPNSPSGSNDTQG